MFLAIPASMKRVCQKARRQPAAPKAFFAYCIQSLAIGYLELLIPSEALCRLWTLFASSFTNDCPSSQWPTNPQPLIAKQQHHSSSTSATVPPASIVLVTSRSHRHQIPIHTSPHIYRSIPGPPAHSASSHTSSPQPCQESFPIRVLARA